LAPGKRLTGRGTREEEAAVTTEALILKSILNWRPACTSWRVGFSEWGREGYFRRAYLISTAFHSGTTPKLR
jgi:hypothetical protein